MGSDSDLPTMQDAAIILDKFGITYELTVVSAHRTPTRMYSYAQSASDRGIKVYSLTHSLTYSLTHFYLLTHSLGR